MTLPKRDLPSRRLGAERLRAAVRGQVSGLSPKTALYLLATRPDIEDRHLDFRVVLENSSESRIMRYLAALYLGRIETPEAVGALEQNLRIRDELVRGRVILSLAGVGSLESLGRIAAIRAELHGWTAAEAAWAARLLAHRHGVAGHEVPMPEAAAYVELGARASRDLGVRMARDEERSALRRSIAVEPLGMSVAWDHVYHLQCGPRAMLLVVSSRVAGNRIQPAAAPSCALAGIIGHWRQDDAAYVPMYFMLTCPAPASDEVSLTLWSPNGRLAFAGTAGVGGSGDVRFSIKGVAGVGALALDVAGTVAHGRIDLSRHRVGLGVVERRAAARSTGHTPGGRPWERNSIGSPSP